MVSFSLIYLLALIGTIQERHDLRAGAGLIGAEHRVGQTVRHALVNGPLDRVGKVSIRRDISKAGRDRGLDEARLDADLAAVAGMEKDQDTRAQGCAGSGKRIGFVICQATRTKRICL